MAQLSVNQRIGLIQDVGKRPIAPQDWEILQILREQEAKLSADNPEIRERRSAEIEAQLTHLEARYPLQG